jgi:amidophosphoribosyltransferase
LSEFGAPFSPDTQEVGEKCAVFVAYNIEEAALVTAAALHSMQHRGQAASGIAVADYGEISRYVGEGLVENVFSAEILSQLPGHFAIGHNRYPTSGGPGHPLPTIENGGQNEQLSFALNGNIALTALLEDLLERYGVEYTGLNDAELMSRALGTLVAKGMSGEEAVVEAYSSFTGAFSAVTMMPDKIMAFRDECGIRPLHIGRMGSGFVVASETCAFDDIGATAIQEVKPGELIVIDANGMRSHQVVSPNEKNDLFELVYFASERSTFKGERIERIRQRMGARLAEECPVDADIVIPVPSSAIPAAQGYAQMSGIEYADGLLRNPDYKKRTFIEPTQEARTRGVEAKLSALPAVHGKRVVVIDDSIVRGTTTIAIVNMLRQAGAREVHVRISSPPVLYPDFYGTDIPRQDTLLAHRRSIEEMRKFLGVDSLGYLSLTGTIAATGYSKDIFSTSCFDGDYSIPIGHFEETINREAVFV